MCLAVIVRYEKCTWYMYASQNSNISKTFCSSLEIMVDNYPSGHLKCMTRFDFFPWHSARKLLERPHLHFCIVFVFLKIRNYTQDCGFNPFHQNFLPFCNQCNAIRLQWSKHHFASTSSQTRLSRMGSTRTYQLFIVTKSTIKTHLEFSCFACVIT